MTIDTVLFDVDGTLVDSNDAHARAWVDAFASAGVTVSYEAVRRCIGMGGDQLMPEVSGIDESSPRGQRIAQFRRERFASVYLAETRAFPQADALVAALHRSGFALAAASSAQRSELQPLLAIAGALVLLDRATSGDDADQSKPDPEIVRAALRKTGASPDTAVMIGDTPYDIEAAQRAGVKAIAFRCGGWWSDAELHGAIAIYDGPADLLAHLDASPLGRLAGERSSAAR